ncbi:MAG: RloB domain-containing protein [Chitinophagaceae bacterium]|jgi:hypothetical protein|nr:RloB domain-containing protein [Chitinophagaceae bacterium]MCA6469038.1 RloB domain-containing protein [Chitinophagaceae bacterium]
MKYLSRHKVYEKVKSFKNAKKIYIFCEGDREVNYLKFFQGFASNIDIIPIPNENGKSDPTKLKAQAEKCLENNSVSLSKELADEVWFVIDTDRWYEGNKIDELRNYVEDKQKTYDGWFVAQSNPSFEIWLYYHFNSEKPIDSEIEAAQSFKDFVATKIKGGFDNRSMPLEIQQATLNAENNFERQNGQPKLYSTEVFNLAKQIIKFTKGQLDQCLTDLKAKTSR